MRMNEQFAIFLYLGLGFACCFTVCESAEPQETRHSGNGVIELSDGVTLSDVVRKSPDSKVRMRITRITRNGERVFESLWIGPSKPSDTPKLLRSYFCDGKLILSQQIGGRDGALPMLVLHDDAGKPMQAFDEKNGGVLVPWTKDRMDNARIRYDLTLESMQPLVDAVTEGESKQGLGKAIEQAVRRATQGIKQHTDNAHHQDE